MSFTGPLDLTITAVLVARRLGPCRTVLLGLALGPALLWSLPPRACGCIRAPFVRCLDGHGLAYRAALRSDLKDLASQEEIHLANEGTYSADPEALGFVPSAGVTVRVVASARGWAATASHSSLPEGQACAISYGPSPPLGSKLAREAGSGEIVCGA